MSQRNPTISKGVDWSLVWIWFILCAIGVTSIFAASWHEGDNFVQGFISLKTDYSRQLLFFIIARHCRHLHPAHRQQIFHRKPPTLGFRAFGIFFCYCWSSRSIRA